MIVISQSMTEPSVLFSSLQIIVQNDRQCSCRLRTDFPAQDP